MRKFTASAIKKDFGRNWMLYLMVFPVILFFIMFNYIPMLGVVVAFKDYTPGLGILGSPWVGLKYFHDFITNT